MIFCSGFCQSVMVLSVGDFLLWDMAIDLVNDMEREREVLMIDYNWFIKSIT